MIRQPMPVYPAQARKARIEGTVALDIVVSKSGDVREIHVVSGPPALVPVAVEAVKQWQYAPRYLNGEPVEIKTRILVPFTLHQ
jgi:protein TonB